MQCKFKVISRAPWHITIDANLLRHQNAITKEVQQRDSCSVQMRQFFSLLLLFSFIYLFMENVMVLFSKSLCTCVMFIRVHFYYAALFAIYSLNKRNKSQ